MGRTPKIRREKKGAKKETPCPTPEKSGSDLEDPHKEENPRDDPLEAAHEARLREALTNEAEAQILLEATKAREMELADQVKELQQALEDAKVVPENNPLPEDDPHNAEPLSDREGSPPAGNRRLQNERDNPTREQQVRDRDMDKIPLPPKLDEKMSAKDINAAIQRVVKSNKPPQKGATPDEWDNYIRIVYRHWVGGRWPNNTTSAAALGSSMEFQFNPMQDLQSLLGDINISMGTDTPMSLTSESDHFTITTREALAVQAVHFLNLIRAEEGDYVMSMNNDRCRSKLITKISSSPFRQVWNTVCLQYDGGQDSIQNLSRAIKQCESNHNAPLIGQPVPLHPAISLNRLNPTGSELMKAQDAVTSPHCLGCDATDHATEECPHIIGFHKRNPGVFRPKDWNKPQPSHCAIHGACAHAESSCTVIPKLRNEPNLQLKARQAWKPSQDNGPKRDKQDRKRPRQEKDTTKLLLQRLDEMDKRIKKMIPPSKEKPKPKTKAKKTKPARVDSDTDSGSNS
jgi:hypothetical protein